MPLLRGRDGLGAGVRRRGRDVVLTLAFAAGERLREAAREWSESRVVDYDAAIETKAEQALLEVEHLVSGATDVTFVVDDETIRHEPSDELREFLAAKSEETGLSEERLLALFADLCASAFQPAGDAPAGR